MPIKVLWYLSYADGHYPWCPDGLYPPDPERYLALARVIDQAGFYGAMVATWPNDPLVSAAYVASHTTRMKFLVAAYSKMTPPKGTSKNRSQALESEFPSHRMPSPCLASLPTRNVKRNSTAWGIRWRC